MKRATEKKNVLLFHFVKSVNIPNRMGTEPSNLLLKQEASLFKHLESLSSLSWLMLNIWEDFAWSVGKRLQICTHHKCHIIFQGGMDFVGSSLSCPPSPCKLHVFSIFRHLYSSRGPLQPCAIKSYPLLNSLYLQLQNFWTLLPFVSLPLQLSLLSHCSPSYFSLIPSHSPSPPLSPSHLYPSITDLCSASSTHSQTIFSHPHLLSSGTLILSSRIFRFLLSLPPTALCCCFLHLILSLSSARLLALFHPSLLFPPVLLALYTHHRFWRVCCSSLLRQFSD